MARKQKEIDPQTLEILSSIAQIIDDGDAAEKPTPKAAAKSKPVAKAKPAEKKLPKEKPVAKKPAAKKPVAKKVKPIKSLTEKPTPKEEEDVLVLTEVAPIEAPKEDAAEEDTKVIQMPIAKEEGPGEEETVVEDTAGKQELDMDNALEELVRDMLKEKLQDYLDQHLSDIIKKVAAEELAKLRKKN